MHQTYIFVISLCVKQIHFLARRFFMSKFNLFGIKLLSSFLIILVWTFSTMAQSVTGTISGMVVDSNGGAIINATVTLISELNAGRRNINTNDEGRFIFSAIQPGVYTIKIEQQGFQVLESKNNTLSANENLVLGE